MNQCSSEQLSVYKESSIKSFCLPIDARFAAIAFAGQADARPAVLKVRLSGIVGHLPGMAHRGRRWLSYGIHKRNGYDRQNGYEGGRATNGVA